VVFASAYRGWGFSLHQFANIYVKKFNCSHNVLMRTLWDDYYINPKTKKYQRNELERQ
jgi:ribosome assembly protein 1